MTALTKWFDSKVKQKRSRFSIIWTLILVVPITVAFRLISSFELFDLYGWISENIVYLTSSSFWASVAGIFAVVFAVARFNIFHYRVAYSVPSTRLQIIWSYICPSQLLRIIIHMACGGFIAFCSTRIIGGSYSYLGKVDEGNEHVSVLNEQHVFLVVHGIFVGGIHEVMFHTFGSHVLRFPILQQTKYFQIKGMLFSLMFKAIWTVLVNMKYFYIIYYLFCASAVRSWSSTGVQPHSNSESEEMLGLNTISTLLSVSLALFTWLSGTFVSIMLSLPNILYTVYQTEALEFPIETTFDHMNDKCLHDALACDSHSLLQYLACLDLDRLTQHSKERRMLIFSVTSLGGHPLNWSNISTACIGQLQKFVDEIVGISDCPPGQGAVRQPVQSQSSTRGTATVAQTYQSDLDLAYRRSGATFLSPGIRALAPFEEKEAPGPSLFRRVFAKMCEAMKVHPVVIYFFTERPDLVNLKQFSNSQKYIWIISGLSRLLSSSFTEDRYGVVQPKLPEILTLYFSLLEALNRQPKQGPIKAKQGIDVEILRLKSALKESVRDAIYRIVLTFDKHLSSIQLSSEHMRKLAMFRDFKE